MKKKGFTMAQILKAREVFQKAFEDKETGLPIFLDQLHTKSNLISDLFLMKIERRVEDKIANRLNRKLK